MRANIMKTEIILPKKVEVFMEVFRKGGFQIYAVGGGVRNALLGRSSYNWDFTTNATPTEILNLFKDNSSYDNKFGTVAIMVEDTPYEVTPFRKESNFTDRRRPDKIEWADTIEEDLKRRDFTINAIGYDGTKIIDPEGGVDDIGKKLVRSVGAPEVRFQEDALRLMRAIRIATELGFTIEESTRNAISTNAPLINEVSGERIRDEFFKILKNENAFDGILLLKNTHILVQILPELDRCFEIPQKSPKRHHLYDVGTHCAMALKYCQSVDTLTRFATLIHDIGKAPTFKKDEKTELITFYNHEIVGAELAKEIAKRFRLSKKDSDKLITLVRFHMFTVNEKQTDKAIKRFIRNVGMENLDDILALRVADRLGSGAKLTSWRTELFKKRLVEVQKEPFKVTDLKINGKDVMTVLNIKPGPKVGQVLDSLFEMVEKGELKNKKKDLRLRLLSTTL